MASDIPRPVDFAFVIGVPRSGTTLLRVLLDSHSRILAPPESPWLLGGYGPDSSLRGLLENLAEGDYGVARNVSGIDRARILAAGRSFLAALYGSAMEARGKALLVFKTPHDIRHLEFLAEFLPAARFVHITRDGRDVCLSQLAKKGSFFHDLKEFGRLNYANAFRRWMDWERKARAVLARPGTRSINLRYEDLVADPARELARITAFLGLAFEPAMLDYAQTAHDYPAWEAGSTDVAARQSISTESVGAWRRRPMTAEMRRVHARHDAFLVEIGYAPSGAKLSVADRAADAAMAALAPARRLFDGLHGLRRRVAGP